MFQDGHDCMDAGGRATQEAKAEDKPKTCCGSDLI